MYQYNLAYRFRYGVEGFTGFTLSDNPDNARLLAIKKVVRKCSILGEIYDEKYLITNDSQVSPEESVTIKKDWEID